MNKQLLFFSLFSFMAASAFSQTTVRAEKALNDPKRAQNSAKADVYVQPKNIRNNTVQTAPVTTIKTTQRKRHYKRKTHL